MNKDFFFQVNKTNIEHKATKTKIQFTEMMKKNVFIQLLFLFCQLTKFTKILKNILYMC